eukprot:gnl/TRDRNA2_/TRDRNA2_154059_c0_seq1.p1 gnl/TRDRNA2_/TRDRNA2_154059_c0~~gnl/TRDRNA2_/TRDRNA2_154059_c0_seq1.p1  ORF type:complete len:330 (-),score=11.00 gnl/TRDRNA2_/TRDRNA2_154059_c0_seq1:28-1017(-)
MIMMCSSIAMALFFCSITGAVALQLNTCSDEEATGFTQREQPTEIAPETAGAILNISNMFPDRRGSCPHITGYNESTRSFLHSFNHSSMHEIAPAPLGVSGIKLCKAPLQTVAEHHHCLVYNFGVSKRDPFLKKMARRYPECDIFAFDPTVSEATWSKEGGSKHVFGQNVHFYSWGLYNGTGPRTSNWSHPRYGKVKGELYTMQEIQSKLGHTQARLSILRADCEGCEWGWVQRAMQEDPSIFQRIDQMFIEAHFASTLRFDVTALHQVKSFHKMIVDNFVVASHRVNNGFRSDQWKVPVALRAIGVDPRSCCREFGLVNHKLFEVASP